MIGSSAALVGSFGATWLANRHALQTARRIEEIQRRENARKVGTGILLIAGELNATLAMTVGLAKSFHSVAHQQPSIVEDLFSHLEALQAKGPKLARAIMQFRTTFNDPDLVSLVIAIGTGADKIAFAFVNVGAKFLDRKELPESFVSDYMVEATALSASILEFEKKLIARLAEPLIRVP